MSATPLPAATDLTGASQTQSQVKTALTNLINWCNERQSQGSDIASASTTDIGSSNGDYVRVTGTTTITGLGTIQAGVKRIVEFTGALTITHNATSLILPAAANITTAAGDVAMFVSKGSASWKCTGYQKSDGTYLVTPSYATSAGSVSVTDPAKTIGYGTGAGGTVTQATSKSTAVTLNKPAGQITMHNAALGAGGVVGFILNNSLITALDTVIVNVVSGSASSYNVWAERNGAGFSGIYVKNISAVSLSEAIGINFAIIKGATS